IFSLGEHPFGQDEIGRDNFARVMKGTQISIIVMFIIGAVCLVIGTIIGALAGYYRGWIDSVLMRITDGFIILPVIVVGSILGVLVGGSSGPMLGLALGCILWVGLARLVRGDFMSLREREFVDSARVAGAGDFRIMFKHMLPKVATSGLACRIDEFARVAGAGDFRIMFKHMLPNAMGVIIVNTTLIMSQAIVLEAALSYLGFGIQPPGISLGQLISEYQTSFATRPWLFWSPGLVIIVIALCVHFIGDGLRDAFDPRMKTIPSWRKMKKAERMAQKGAK